MRNRSTYLRTVKRITNAHRRFLNGELAIPVFTVFIKPVDVKDKSNNDVAFGYVMSGQEQIPPTQTLEAVQNILGQITK